MNALETLFEEIRQGTDPYSHEGVDAVKSLLRKHPPGTLKKEYYGALHYRFGKEVGPWAFLSLMGILVTSGLLEERWEARDRFGKEHEVESPEFVNKEPVTTLPNGEIVRGTHSVRAHYRATDLFYDYWKQLVLQEDS
jgi:hypothetical protein